MSFKIKNRKRFIKWLWLIVFSPVILILVALLLVWIFADIPSFEELEDPQSNLATQIIADDGTLLNTYHVENRSYSNYEELSQNLKDALVATEDARFYDHSGIDGKSLVRVAVKSIALGNRAEGGGGSTLSQQLAKSLFPRGEGKGKLKLITTKLKEWITAVKLERSYTKEEIMSMYLDAVFFGRNAYGIKSASATFFGKLPKDLTVEEAALLVGMVNKPTKYNPVRNPELSLQRRNHVLKQMNKYGYLTDAQYDSIVKIPIILASRGDVDVSNGQAPYFRDMLKRIMSASEPKRSSYANYYDYQQDSINWKDNPLYGWLNKNFKPNGEKYVLEKDGLKIITPINPKMQRYAEQAAVEHLKYLQPLFRDDLKYRKNFPFADGTPQNVIETLMSRARRWSDRYKNMKEAGFSESEIEKSFTEKTKMRVFAWNDKGYIDTLMTPDDSIRYFKSFLRTGLMAMEPETGYVRAYVGGANYNYFKYDQVMQGQRQVGSTFKPFLYTLAMQEGFTPCDVTVNLPQSFVIGNNVWTPKGGGNGATVTLKWGITTSNNNVSAYLMKQFGPEALVQMAHNMGLKCYLEPVHSLCVGSADVPVYQMVSAYNTFPGMGVYVDPLYVLRIEDKNGRVLTNFASRKREAIGASTAYTMIGMMRSVVDAGTGARIRRYIQGGEIAGKTGTTNDNSDGWFIGYVPRLTVGVWVGAEDRQVHFRWTGMGQGASVALPIWALMMKKVLDDPSIPISIDDHFAKPQGYSIDCIPAHSTSDPDVDADNFIEEN
ncbi:MAG: transglycosylase domain-containing protein [Bacteroidales bacterium]|nr:transglycosylase domain-containing protein [Bacteroidales bacterium]